MEDNVSLPLQAAFDGSLGLHDQQPAFRVRGVTPTLAAEELAAPGSDHKIDLGGWPLGQRLAVAVPVTRQDHGGDRSAA